MPCHWAPSWLYIHRPVAPQFLDCECSDCPSHTPHLSVCKDIQLPLISWFALFAFTCWQLSVWSWTGQLYMIQGGAIIFSKQRNSCKDKVLIYENWKYATSAFACSHSHKVKRHRLGGCYGNKSLEEPTLLHEDVLCLQKEAARQTDLDSGHSGVSAKGWELEVRFLKETLWFGDMSLL